MAFPAISKANAVFPAYHPMISQGKASPNAGKPDGDDTNPPESTSSKKNAPETASKTTDKDLAPPEKKQVEELRKRDQEVKAHELAHVAAGGQYISGQINYSYQTGPDGQRYAVGGDVSIDMSEVPGDPSATVRKMQAVRMAAMAPASPSQTDRAVAAKATQIETKARMESLLEKVREKDKQEATDPRTDLRSATTHYENQTGDTGERGRHIDIAA